MRSVFVGAVFALTAAIFSATAQPMVPPEVREAATISTEQRAEMKAEIAAAKAQAKASGATREQIRALRSALRAKLAAMRH